MTPEQHTPALQRRNLGLLVAAQSLGGASPPIIISLGGLVGQQLSTNPTATTLPVSIYQLGLALSTLPAAWLMQRMGRRTAYVLGAILGVVSGVIAAQGIAQSDFVTFCIGTALAGFYAACVQSYRFAATDAMTDPAEQARAISRVMIGGLIAAIIGPQVVIWTRDALPMTPFAGSFYSQAVLALLALPLLLGLKLPPPQARAVAGEARPLAEIARTPQFILAASARRGRYRLHGLSDDGRAHGHGGLRPHGGRGGAGHPVACAGHVRAQLLHGPADRALWQAPHHGAGAGDDRGLGPDGADGAGAAALLGLPGAAGRGLELRLHRRHGHGDRVLPPCRARQGAGPQ